ncbi:uncharacterized protein Pbp45 [Diabrotica undecimpunctata]|uniref:uncharacterized protein Pbp45 n=1 Tax=Diabrotica undecimpunctata TaxID=50387 RepID=UPI003B63F002
MERHAKLPMYTFDKELASAFQLDCEVLLDEFELYQSFGIEDFQKVWQNHRFSNVFAGQTYALLLKDFCENCFYIVKKYIYFPRTLYTQVGAFYLLAILYYKQPVRTWVKIRLTSEEYEKIHGLILEMINRKVYEPVYMFSKLKADKAFTYVSQRKPLGPEDRFVKDFHMYINDTFISVKTTSSLTKFKNSFGPTDIPFNKLKETCAEYSQLMHKFAETCPGITPFSSNLVRDIETANLLIHGEDKIPEEKPVQDERTPLYDIKQRAMANKNAVYRANRNVITGVDYDRIESANGQNANDASS